MKPLTLPDQPANLWAMGHEKTGLVVYTETAGAVTLNLAGMPGTYAVKRIHPKAGTLTTLPETVKGGGPVTVAGEGVIWLKKIKEL